MTQDLSQHRCSIYLDGYVMIAVAFPCASMRDSGRHPVKYLTATPSMNCMLCFPEKLHWSRKDLPTFLCAPVIVF